MYSRTLTILSFLFFASCLSGQQGDPEFIEKEIRRVMRKQHLPAMAVSVVRGDEVLYQEVKGMIDLENQIPASTRSLFKLWSLAKPFTAIEIFREIEEGLVELDAPLTTYLPDFTIQSMFSDKPNPTIRELLAHRAGLPRNAGLMPAGMKRDLNHLERFECGVSSDYAAYPTGSRYKYSNLGYDLLGRVIEVSRNEGFFKRMKLNILNELGMQNADFYSGAIDSSLQRALGYEYHKRKYYPLVQYDINDFPSGNLYATIEDLSAFLQALFRMDLFEYEKTLSRMLADYYSRPGDPEMMGLGWKLALLGNGDTLVWHDGGPSEGIGSLVAFLPEYEIGIAVIGNGTSYSGFYSLQFAMKIFDRLMDKTPGDMLKVQPKPAVQDLSAEKLKKFEGQYAAFGSIAEVKLKGKRLKAVIGDISLILVPMSETEFAVSHWMEKIGLTKIIAMPVDLTKIKVSFREPGFDGSGAMVLNMMDASHEICPKYPVQKVNQEQWKELCRSYRRAERIPGRRWGELSNGLTDIRMEKGVLMMSGFYGPIVPVNDTVIRILSGPYHGEFMNYMPASGVILHQKNAFIPVRH